MHKPFKRCVVIESVEGGDPLPVLERMRLRDEKARIQPVDEDEDVVHYYEHAADGGDVNAQVPTTATPVHVQRLQT